MILADTSVWVEHFRKGNPALGELLNRGVVLSHPFVVGELACGNLGNRRAVLDYLRALPQAPLATDDEAMDLVEIHKLSGLGAGWIDVHLAASALLSHADLWTLDQRLLRSAQKAGVSLHRPRL